MYKTAAIDVHKLVTDLGGYPFVADMIKRCGFRPIGVSAVYKWRERGGLSGRQLLTLIAVCRETERRLNIEDYISIQEPENAAS